MRKKLPILIIFLFLVTAFLVPNVLSALEENPESPSQSQLHAYPLIPAHSTLVEKTADASDSATSEEPISPANSTEPNSTMGEWRLVRYTRTGAIYNNGTVSKLETSPGTLNAWNGTAWVPYIFEDRDDYYFVATGWFAAEIYPSKGYAVFYDANRTEVRIGAEWWRVDVLVNDTWREALNTLGGAKEPEVFLNETHAYITLCFEVEGVGHLNVTYVVEGGRPIKHSVAFVSDLEGENSFRIVQVLEDVYAEGVRVGEEIKTINATTVLNEPRLEFYMNGTFRVFEDPRDPAYNCTVVSPNGDSALRAEVIYFGEANYTISEGDAITLDPHTATVYATSYDLIKGSVYSGSLSNTQSDDDVYFTILSGYSAGTGQYTYAIEFIMGGSLPSTAVVSSVDVYVYLKNSKSIGTQIELFDYEANTWDTLLITTIGTSEYHFSETGLGSEYYDVSNNEGEIRVSTGGSSTGFYGYFDLVKMVVYYNTPPTISSASITNMDDTDNMYARYREYNWTVVVNDPDGYGDIDQVHFVLAQGTTERCGVYWDKDTGFAERSTNNDWIALDATSSTHSGSGTSLTIKFYVWIEWDFGDEDDLEIRCYVKDSGGLESGWQTLQTNYVDVDTSVTVRNFAVDDTRAVSYTHLTLPTN